MRPGWRGEGGEGRAARVNFQRSVRSAGRKAERAATPKASAGKTKRRGRCGAEGLGWTPTPRSRERLDSPWTGGAQAAAAIPRPGAASAAASCLHPTGGRGMMERRRACEVSSKPCFRFAQTACLPALPLRRKSPFAALSRYSLRSRRYSLRSPPAFPRSAWKAGRRTGGSLSPHCVQANDAPGRAPSGSPRGPTHLPRGSP